MAKPKLDKTDLQILQILQENSKITNLDLSKKIDLSPAPTLERVKKLESSNIIKSYHAHVNAKAIGLSIEAYLQVSLDWQRDNALNKFKEQIKDINEISECHVVTGEYDLLLRIICEDTDAYETLLFEKLSKIEEIKRTNTMVALSTIKEYYVLPIDYDKRKKRR